MSKMNRSWIALAASMLFVPAVLAQAPPQGRVPRQLDQTLAQARQVAWGQQEAGLVFKANLFGAVAIVSDNRPRRRQGLRQCARQPLA